MSNLEYRVEQWFQANPIWRTICQDGEECGGLCQEASEAFQSFAGGEVIEIGHLPEYEDHIQQHFKEDGVLHVKVTHWVCKIGSFIVDLTARQFNPALPMPFIFPVPE